MAKSLQIQQLDNKIQTLASLQNIVMPPIGWIKNIRLALGISLRQLGEKLSVTKQSIQEREEREIEGTITLKALKETAEAMDMQFVYGFIPKDGSLEALIDRKSTELATQIVMRTSATMKLEDQENSKERLQLAIKERAELLKREMPKILWD
jgi:predicted DNA-binding mobile mystery protein A